ncbi:MAG: carboxypeptidase regulatory-like domain-containing protein [Alistipes sp.]|nr:carboxypeptidase regulatory-like domain-containing protein [Alistipes sp.]
MKRLLIIAFLGLLSLSALAQGTRTVKGYVRDAEGEPLQGATIKAVSDSATTTSTAKGTFEMQVSLQSKFVEASLDGYIAAQAEIDGSIIVFKLKVDKKYAANKAKAEKAARIAAEQEAARLAAEREAIRLAAEKEAARIAAEKAAAEEAARLAAEQEKQRLIAEAKAKAAEEARVAAEKAKAEEAARIAAEQEKQRLIAEAKAKAAEEARVAAEKAKAEEAARIAAEQEKQRLLAEANAKAEEEARIAVEQEKARIIAEAKKQAEEEARIAAEKEKARIIAEAKAQAEEERARIIAEAKAKAEQEARATAEKQAAAPSEVAVVQIPPTKTVAEEKQSVVVAQPAQQSVVTTVPQQTSQAYETASNRDEDQVPLEKKPKKPLKKNRFGQMLEFGFMATAQNLQNIQALDMAASLNYALGCNFNNMVFLGVGTGIIWNIDGGVQEMGPAGDGYPGGSSSSYYPEMEIGALPLATFSIPAYIHFKVNMSRDTKVAPYFALTAGAEFSPIREQYHPTPNHTLSYNQMSIFGKASLGVNFRIGDKSAIYLGVGYRIDNRYGARLFSGDAKVYPVKYWVHGLTANLGFLF